MKGDREKLKKAVKNMFAGKEENDWLGYLKKNHKNMTKEQRMAFLVTDRATYDRDYGDE